MAGKSRESGNSPSTGWEILPGAYSPVVVDLTGSGHPDIVACCGFNDWKKPDSVSLMCFENDGAGHFTPRILAHEPTHLTLVVKAADMFNDGRIELVTGALHVLSSSTIEFRASKTLLGAS